MRFTYHETNNKIKLSYMDFTTHTNEHTEIDFDLFGFNEFAKENFKFKPSEIDSTNPSAIIEWASYIETRSWGIKSFDVFATQIKGLEISVEYYADDIDETLYEKTFDLTELIKDFELKSETTDQNMFCVQRVELDFERKEITINF